MKSQTPSKDYLTEFKKTKKRNPIMVQAEERGYKKGYEVGRDQTINFAVNFLENLEDVEGIGTKTAQKIRDKFLEKYGVKNSESPH